LLLLPILAGTFVLAAPPQQVDEFGLLVLNTRADLELLADGVLGEGQRPEGWTANDNVNSSTLVSDLWFDAELLANAVFGATVRPPDWVGATTTNAELLARNIRFNVELTADRVFDGRTRPDEWRGAPRSLLCSRSLQNVVNLLQTYYEVQFTTPQSALDYCQAVEIEAEERLVANAGTTDPETLKDLTLAVRGDLERLADEKLGLNTRPPAWVGNVDRESPTLAGDVFLDIETLASELPESNPRPPGWIGTLSNNLLFTYRNLRYDLELLADVSLGINVRPRGWQGVNPVERCEPIVQDLVLLVQTTIGFTTDNVPPDNFCTQVEEAANVLAENPPIEDIVEEQDSRFVSIGQSAFTYLDVGATQFMGVMPPGTRFRAWYRNFAASTMMFVSGDDFAVYVDQRWTDLTQDIFDRLPTLEGVAPLTFCDASWCNGPGPTPTPTGFGALALLLNEATAPAPPSVEEVAQKTQVSWSNIRVSYLSDNAQARTSQVTLEICAEPAQITCEPVLRVFDNNTGVQRNPVSQFNNLNVYDFAWGYTANLLIEGATLTSPDVWISDPTIR
jgi:hypothetical protein